MINLKQIKKIFIVGTFLLSFSNLCANEIKEIRLLDDYSREILGESSKKVKDLSKLEKVKNKKIDYKNIEKKYSNSKINKYSKISIDSIVDIYEKTSENNIVYKKGESKPFTGVFGIVLDKKIEFYEEYKNGVLNGETAWFSRETGHKLLSEFYSNAKLNGEQKTFYENGNLKSIVYYKKNKINGLVTYNSSGKILHKSIFKNGTGTWKFFWSNGNVLEEGKYTSWRKDGIWKRYRKDGSLEKVTVYNKGRMTKQSWK